MSNETATLILTDPCIQRANIAPTHALSSLTLILQRISVVALSEITHSDYVVRQGSENGNLKDPIVILTPFLFYCNNINKRE